MILALFTFQAFAQEKISNNDLRTDLELFSIKYKKKKELAKISLKRSKQGSHQLIFGKESEDTSTKIDSQEAIEIDQSFSDTFIHLKYILESNFTKKCKNEIELSLRGEIFQICSDDESREPIVKEIIEKLKKKKA